MPSVRYYNQTAPFWDFVASMEEQARTHASASGPNDSNTQEGTEPENANPWEGMYFPFGPFAHRGRRGHGPHGRHEHGPPQPPPPPPHPHDHEMTSGDEKEHDPEEGPSQPRGPHGHGSGPRDHGHHKAGFGGPGGRGGRCGGRGGRGRWGGRGGPMGGFDGFAGLADAFQSQFFDGGKTSFKASEDFQPEVDVFDAPESFVVHVSLPGAKKEDVGVNWDAEKSELSIAGVIYRPGDEEFLKTLALDERKIGAFERKVRLGSRANPAQIDVDGITAKMEDGVLRVEVPKLDAGYVEIKKVDIE